MATVQPDPRIAAYIREIEAPGVAYVNRSQFTLGGLYSKHGRDVIDRLVNEYFAAKRADTQNA